jgi:hypothetical protein
MDEQARYETMDLPFYRSRIAPMLPPKVLDFHAHAWRSDQWKHGEGGTERGPDETRDSASVGPFRSAKYMATGLDYPMEQLLNDGRRMFPDRDYRAVCFGQPTPAVDVRLTNRYITQSSKGNPIFPLIVAGGGSLPVADLRAQILNDGFFGIKVFLNWVGNDYGHVRVEDMLTPSEMELADELKLIVLLHVPRAERLADSEIQRGVRDYALRYPGASIVLAHCGRCYTPDEMKKAIHSVCDLGNVYMDTAMVMDPLVLEMVLRAMGPERLLYATDFPVAAMRGRRVNIMDHWVDVVLEGYPKSDFRVASDGIRATFMAYEIAMAVELAADAAGMTEGQLHGMFFDNGMALLKKAANGTPRESRLD